MKRWLFRKACAVPSRRWRRSDQGPDRLSGPSQTVRPGPRAENGAARFIQTKAMPVTLRGGLAAAAACLVTGCLVGPKYQVPVATVEPLPAGYKETPSQYKGSGGWKVARPKDAMLRGAWWKVFHDPQLNALEADLDINDQNIKQYFENFMIARALVGEQRAQLYPTITANGSYTAARTPPLASTLTTAQAVLDLSWEPDLWGRIRNLVRGAQYNAQISAADLEGERLSEQASLATYYFELRGQDALAVLYKDTIVAYQKALDFTQAQFETGITDKIAVVEATNTLQNAEATLTNLGVARAQYEHAIAVLTGRVASKFSIPPSPLKATPPPLPVGLPSQMLERRPDIAGAERAMASANAEIGSAYAAYYPTLTLGASGGNQGSNFHNLFNAANRIWSLGPSVSETIYDAGLRRATINQYVATYNANLAAYRQTVLVAFQQVEDYLAQVRILSKQLIQQRAAEQSAEQYVQLETGRFQTGVDPYLNVTVAQTTLLTDQQDVITVQVQEMTGAVQLIKALGGGWDRSELPTPDDVKKTPTDAETTIQH